MEEPPLVFLNQRPLSSAFYTKRSSLDLYIETNQELAEQNAGVLAA
jgi:hypothetical protein